MKAREFITEAFDQPYPIEWEKWADGEAVDALATLDDGTNLSIMFRKEGTAFLCSDWMVEFQRNNSQEITGEGDAQRVFATVQIPSLSQPVKSQNLKWFECKVPGQIPKAVPIYTTA